YGEAAAVAKVIEQRRSGIGKRRQRQDVGAGEVFDVDVVADAGAVGSRIVVAIDVDAGAAAEGDVENDGDQVRLGFVGFAVSIDRARDVEVAERSVTQAVDAVEPGQHLLDEELGLAIRIGRGKPRGFEDRRGFGLAIDGSGRAEDKVLRATGYKGFEQRERRRGVGAEVEAGVFHRLAGFN